MVDGNTHLVQEVWVPIQKQAICKGFRMVSFLVTFKGELHP